MGTRCVFYSSHRADSFRLCATRPVKMGLRQPTPSLPCVRPYESLAIVPANLVGLLVLILVQTYMSLVLVTGDGLLLYCATKTYIPTNKSTGAIIPASIPILIFPAALETKPTSVGPPEQPRSPARASIANSNVPLFLMQPLPCCRFPAT